MARKRYTYKDYLAGYTTDINLVDMTDADWVDYDSETMKAYYYNPTARNYSELNMEDQAYVDMMDENNEESEY